MVGVICSAIPPVDAASRLSFIKPNKPYSSCTLIGNWYNDRINNEVKKYNPINTSPITTGSRSTAQTSYRVHYAHPKEIFRPDAPTFEQQRARYKINVHKGKDSSVLIMDSKKYLSNYTTLNDIKYRLQPPQDNWSMITDRPVKTLPKENLLQSYGNKTNFGLRHWLTQLRNQAKLYRSDDTTYADEFRHPKQPKRKDVHHCKWTETWRSINLWAWIVSVKVLKLLFTTKINQKLSKKSIRLKIETTKITKHKILNKKSNKIQINNDYKKL